MLLNPTLLVSILCILTAEASAKAPPNRIVSDPLASYYRTEFLPSYYGEFPFAADMRGGLQIVVADFDCDGRSDLAISDTSQVGTAGAWWVIYIRRKDGRFTEIGSVGTKGNRFRIIRDKKCGGGRLAVMLRGGPGHLGIEYYRVTPTSLRLLADEEVHLREEDVGITRIEKVFGPDYSVLPATITPYASLQARFPNLKPAAMSEAPASATRSK